MLSKIDDSLTEANGSGFNKPVCDFFLNSCSVNTSLIVCTYADLYLSLRVKMCMGRHPCIYP